MSPDVLLYLALAGIVFMVLVVCSLGWLARRRYRIWKSDRALAAIHREWRTARARRAIS